VDGVGGRSTSYLRLATSGARYPGSQVRYLLSPPLHTFGVSSRVAGAEDGPSGPGMTYGRQGFKRGPRTGKKMGNEPTSSEGK